MTSVVSKNIRYLRKQRKMSQSSLGDKLGKSESAIQMWESDKRSPTMGTIQQLSELFNVDISTLVYTDLSTGERFHSGYLDSQEDNYIQLTASEAAKKFITNQELLKICGLDISKLTDEQITEFANQILESAKFFASKFK